MLQTSILSSTHGDLVTDAAYDFYGLRLATTSLDQRIKIWRLDESTNQWVNEDDWKAHNAPVSRLSWAHPEYGTILASCSFDKHVKIWEEVGGASRVQLDASAANQGPKSKWIERADLPDSKASVRAIEFAPRYFDLKLAVLSSDSILRVYKCHSLHNVGDWSATITIDVSTLSIQPALRELPSEPGLLALPATSSDGLLGPSGLSGSLLSTSASSNSFSIGSGTSSTANGGSGRGLGRKEADGGWSISWCKDKTWGELCAVTAGATGTIKILQFSSSQLSRTVLTLHSSGQTNVEETPAPAITSVAWAPSCGRRYHLLASGGRDGNVRLWRLTPPAEDYQFRFATDAERWKATNIGTFDDHRSAVTRVEWNVTGTVLSSAGNDGNIRLWKATFGGTWRPMGHIHTEHGDEESPSDGMEEG